MKKNTRFAFNAYLQQLARLNGVAVEELSSKFTVEPSVQQTLEDQIQQTEVLEWRYKAIQRSGANDE
ncbi:GpE family phage tail protein [Escherichia coli]|nr:P2 family phage major capsid protein [Escherichia coli]MXF24538.1 GpE family phage tail protein [Escherichia coli]